MTASRRSRGIAVLSAIVLSGGIVLAQASAAPAVSVIAVIDGGIGEDPTMVVTSAGDRAFIGSDGSIQVVDTDPASSTFNSVITDITNIGPTAIAASSDGSLVYAAGSSSTVVAYSSANGDEVGSWEFPAYDGAKGDIAAMALTGDGSTMWVAMSAFDGWTGVAAMQFSGGTMIGQTLLDSSYDLHGLALSPDGTLVFAVGGDILSSRLYVIDAATFDVVQSISLGGAVDPQDVAVTPDGSTVVVTNWEADSVSIVSSFEPGQTPDVATIQGVHDAQDVAISPDGYTAYVTGSDGLTAIDVRNPNAPVGATYDVGDDPYGVGISADGQHAYVSNDTDDGTVTVLDVPAISPLTQVESVVPGQTVSTAGLVATGFDGLDPTFSVANGSLPEGLSLNPTTGAISGIMPDTSVSITVDAQSGSQVAGASISLTVAPFPAISPASQVVDAVVGFSMATSPITPANFSSSPTYSVAPVTLPAGLTLDSATGVISGTPVLATQPEVFTLTATAGQDTATATVTLSVTPTVSPAAQSQQTTIELPFSSMPLVAQGFPNGDVVYSSGSALPPGLTLNPSNGVISGTLTAPFVKTLEITASGSGFTATAAVRIEAPLDLVVREAKPTFDAGSEIDTKIVEPIGFPSATTVSTVPALPQGLTLSRDGQLTGTAVVAQSPVDTVITFSSGSFSRSVTVKIGIDAVLSPQTTVESVPVGSLFSTAVITPYGFSTPPTFSISPDLPDGLTLDAASGSVSGRFSRAASLVTYTLTASSGSVTATAKLSLSTTDPAGAVGEPSTVASAPSLSPVVAPESASGGGSDLLGTPITRSANDSVSVSAASSSGASSPQASPVPSPAATADGGAAAVSEPLAQPTDEASSPPFGIVLAIVLVLVGAVIAATIVFLRRRSS